MDVLGYFNIKKPDVISETIDGETVIVNLENGIYYNLGKSGADVWSLIENGMNFEELTTEITKRYSGARDEIENALRDLLVKLQQEGLLQVTSTRSRLSESPQITVETGKEKLKFEIPILEKYSDMQQLLLLDPIHEVDDEGWPHKGEVEDNGDVGQG